MAGEPALDKILTGLKAALDAGVGGALVEIDRGEDEAYGNAELVNGAINVIHLRTAFSMHETGVQIHRAFVDLDLVVAIEPSAANGARLRELEAKAVEALAADPSLGGRAQEIILAAAGGDDDVRADDGARSLSVQILFLTPVGNHRTIIGAAGLIP